MNTLNHPDIVALFDAITHDNWFDQLHPLADRFLELGDQAKYDRCMDLIVDKKRPRHYEEPSNYYWNHDWEGDYDNEYCLLWTTVDYIDKLNSAVQTRTIQPQLTGYLQVPEELRIPRTKGR